MDENQKEPLSGQVPPPPPPEIGVRTMQSDLQSMQKSGGDPPQPYIINAGAAAPQRPAAEPTPTAQPKINVNVQGYTGPEQPIFQETNEPIFTPSEQTAGAGGANNESGKKGGGFKIIIWITAIVAIAGGLGALGYFVVFPILFPTPKPIVIETPQPEPILPTPAPTPIPSPEPATTTEPTATTSPEIIPAPTSTPITEIKPHISFFTASSAVSQEKTASELFTLENIRLVASTTATGLNLNELKEIVFEKSSGSLLPASEFLANIMPELSSSSLKQFFEEDITYFIFKNDQGIWPGYVLKLNQIADMDIAKIAIASLETLVDFGRLFIQDPGAITQPFKDGKAGDLATRYQVYTQKGAALNYGWFKNYLIISASYTGLTETLKNL